MFTNITVIPTPLEELSEDEIKFIQQKLRLAYLYNGLVDGQVSNDFLKSWNKFQDLSFISRSSSITKSILDVVKEIKGVLVRTEPIVSPIRDDIFLFRELEGLPGETQMIQPINISKTFTWGKATRNGKVKTSSEIIENIRSFTVELERIESEIKYSFEVVSWLRTRVENIARHGHIYSLHLKGLAVDVLPVNCSAQDLYNAISPKWRYGLAVGPTVVHIDFRKYKARWTYAEGST